LAGGKSEEITIHSQMYPTKEAEKIAQATDFLAEHIIIIGLGLGYVCHALRVKYPDKKMILVEPDIKLFYLAIKHCDLGFMGFECVYVGYDSIDNIGWVATNSGSQFDVYTQKSQERLYPSVFARINNSLMKRSNYNLSDNWKYKKFASEQTKVLYIDSSYVLTKECLNAIKNTGNLVHYIHIDIDNYDYEQFIRSLMNDISLFKPDFVLTINHLGFDEDGRLTELFSEMELPFVSWFVDSPNVILATCDRNVSDFCNIFVWDDDYISQVKEKGYKNCDYLPLATDTDIFYPKDVDFAYNVSFVGSSMVYAIHKNMKSWAHRGDLLAAFPDVVNSFLSAKSRHVEGALDVLSEKKIYFDSVSQEEDFKASVLWKGTQVYRQSGINKIAKFMPTVAGDQNWKNILPIEYDVISERWYYDDLCDYYNQSVVNFNMTSLQMTNAVNQRVFDVSACRKFILTDYRKQLKDFFGSKENIVWFDDVEEIPDLLAYYLKNEGKRNRIAQNAYEIVCKDHTYKHRINEMINTLKKKYT